MAQLREPPLHRLVAAEDVPQEGLDVIVEATHEERNELASFLGLPQIGRLVGTFHVQGSPQRLTVTGQVEASITQACVVSLDPFETAVSESVAVAFADPATAAASSREGRVSVTSSREPPDEIVDGRIDLGALTAEFLALGLDPYPRKPGVTFSFSTQSEAGPSPFAALTKIKFDESAGG